MSSITAYAGTAATDSSNGGSVNWTNPSNATGTANASFATAALDCALAKYLKLTNFDFSAIPGGATIDGIKVEVDAKSDATGTVLINALVLVKAGTPHTSWVNSDGGTMNNSLAFYSYGGATDRWFGLPGDDFSLVDVQNSGWGVAIEFQESCTAADVAYVDAVRMTVYYTAAPASSVTGRWKIGLKRRHRRPGV